MSPDNIRDLIRVALPDAQVEVIDLTGTRDHWEVHVTSSAFEDKHLLAQHRLVKDALGPQIKDGTIHALSLKTFTPS